MMAKLAHILAGCPLPAVDREKLHSFRTFPCQMISRMYNLLTRPARAIAESGDGDYRTPFLFFLFWSIVLEVVFHLADSAWMTFFVNTQPGLPESVGIFIFSLPSILAWVFFYLVSSLIVLGISVIILAAVLWIFTGKQSWNPAFTICAYCLPVQVLIQTVYSIVSLPFAFSPFTMSSPSAWLGVAGVIVTAVGYIAIAVIAAYGTMALAGMTRVAAVLVVVFWVTAGFLAISGAYDLFISPLQSGFSDMLYSMTRTVTMAYFPVDFPTVGSLR